MSAFKLSIDSAIHTILTDINKKVYEISWALFTSVVQFSPSKRNPGPWAKGLLANQWYPSNGVPSSAESTATSGSGADSLNRINSFAAGGREFYKRDGKVYLSNNVEYAWRAEYGGWPTPRWKGAKPYGMMAKSLQVISHKYKRVTI